MSTQLQDFEWQASDAEDYDEAYNELPAAAMRGKMFLFGEPMDHRGEGGAARFLVYRCVDNVYTSGSRSITIAEFRIL
jgi:hypothetical protein